MSINNDAVMATSIAISAAQSESAARLVRRWCADADLILEALGVA